MRIPGMTSYKPLLALVTAIAGLALAKCAIDKDSQLAGGNAKISGLEEAWPVRRYPNMVARLGPDIFDRATLYVPTIANQISRKPPCNKVTTVEMERSSRPSAVGYRIYCQNGYSDQVFVDFTAPEATT
ncbi:MAG TPA: hypothetical protein VGE05_07990 [Novosphingobium sp.]